MGHVEEGHMVPNHAEPKSKGMSDEQKQRLRNYMDDFKNNNAGCVICQRKASEFHTMPEIVDGHIELYLYGACIGHTMISNSDAVLEAAVGKLKSDLLADKPANPRLVSVTYDVDREELRYA